MSGITAYPYAPLHVVGKIYKSGEPGYPSADLLGQVELHDRDGTPTLFRLVEAAATDDLSGRPLKRNGVTSSEVSADSSAAPVVGVAPDRALNGAQGSFDVTDGDRFLIQIDGVAKVRADDAGGISAAELVDGAADGGAGAGASVNAAKGVTFGVALEAIADEAFGDVLIEGPLPFVPAGVAP